MSETQVQDKQKKPVRHHFRAIMAAGIVVSAQICRLDNFASGGQTKFFDGKIIFTMFAAQLTDVLNNNVKQ